MATSSNDLVSGAPTKAFFAQTLTRDIELKDAILDLLDNCVDGLMRSIPASKLSSAKPYVGHWAHISFNDNKFVIEDNCGGIDIHRARTSAFRMGRVGNELGSRERKLPTVGAYGIGMKRAIFKMGRSGTVTSRTKTEAFEVVIPATWLEDEMDWNLKLTVLRPSTLRIGTRIEVRNLRESIKKQFVNLSGFADDFYGVLSQQFAIIIKKGFEITINGRRVKPKPFRFISVDLDEYVEGVAPFLFKGTIEQVKVDLSVGFYKPVPDPSELEDEEEEAATFTANEAGWNIICNDRVVLTHDTTHLTGWGIGGVPSFHNQFIAIAGTVRFTADADNVSKLPLTTTKRGVDLNSELYQRVRDKMQEGTKVFTSFTNRLQKVPEERKKVFHKTSSIEFDQLDAKGDSADLKWVTDKSKLVGGRTFSPKLPKFAEDRFRVVRFSRPKEEITALASFLFDDDSTKPGEVGGACFDRVLEEASKA
jgi:hypothetical protein